MPINNVNAGRGIFINTAPSTASNSAVGSGTSTDAGSGDFAGVLKSVSKTVDLDSIFEAASGKYGVPADLLKAVAKAESNFNPAAVSNCGAQGVMQLMPYTAKSLGVADSFDAEQNIMGGAKLLSQLLEKYDGNTQLALAAYNAGPGNVEKYGGIPPFAETQNYVTKVMGYLGSDLTAGMTSVYSGQAYGSAASLASDAYANADPEDIQASVLMQIYQLEKNLLAGLNVSNESDNSVL